LVDNFAPIDYLVSKMY